MVVLLCQHHADVDIQDGHCTTPLNLVSSHGELKVTCILLLQDTVVDLPNGNHWTPLNVALQSRHLEIVQLLLQSEAAVNTCTYNWDTLY
jgi:ankyrin repeat protein